MNDKKNFCPHDPDTERLVIGCCLLGAVPPMELQAADFFGKDRALVYGTILFLHDRGDVCDLVTVKQHLEREGTLEKVGGAAALAAMTEGIPKVERVDTYAQLLIEKARARQMLIHADKLSALILNGNDATARAHLVEALVHDHEGLVGSAELERLDLTAPTEPVPQVVHAIVPAQGRTLIAGPSNVGKSIMAQVLAVSVAAGVDFLGQEQFRIANNDGPVFIVEEESPRGAMSSRMNRCCRGLGVKPAALVERLYVFSQTGVSVGQPETWGALMRAARGLRPCLVILDPAAAIIAGNPLDDVDVIGYYNAVAGLQRLGAAIVTVHHTGWVATGRPKGSTVWRDRTDVELVLSEAEEPGSIKVIWSKVKDGEKPAPSILMPDWTEDSFRFSHASAPDESQPRRQQHSTLTDAIWEFVREEAEGPFGGEPRRPVGEVHAKFAPGRKGKTQMYAAIKRLLERSQGSRLVRDGDSFIAIE